MKMFGRLDKVIIFFHYLKKLGLFILIIAVIYFLITKF